MRPSSDAESDRTVAVEVRAEIEVPAAATARAVELVRKLATASGRTVRAKERGQRAHGAAQTRVPGPSHPRTSSDRGERDRSANVTVPTTSRWEDRIEVASRPGRSYSSSSTVMTQLRPKPRGRAVKRLPRPTGPSVVFSTRAIRGLYRGSLRSSATMSNT